MSDDDQSKGKDQQVAQVALQRKRLVAPPPFEHMTGTAIDPQQVWHVCLFCSCTVVASPGTTSKPWSHRAGCSWLKLQQRLYEIPISEYLTAWSPVGKKVRELILKYPNSMLRFGDIAEGPEVTLRIPRTNLYTVIDRLADAGGMRWSVDPQLRLHLKPLPVVAVAEAPAQSEDQ